MVNDRGHLNPDINRSARSPWGSFVGTWQAERMPIQLKTRTKLTAHLYGSSGQASSKSSNRAGSAKLPIVYKAESEPPTTQSPQSQALRSPKDGSRPNTSDSNSSWVVIENPPSRHASNVDSRPSSHPKSNSRGSVMSSPSAEGSRAQSAVLASRSPTPAAVRQSPSLRSPSVMSAGDDISLPPARSNTAVSPQQTNSRPHSRLGGSSQALAQSPMAGVGSRSVSTASQNNLHTFEDVIASPHLIEQ
jgi:hypothetical protein